MDDPPCPACQHVFDQMYALLAAGEARAAALQDEVDVLHNCGIIEIAVRNKSGSVSDYMNHWEGRALKAETLLADVILQRDEFFARLERVEREAEAAIVSLQVERDDLLADRDDWKAAWKRIEASIITLTKQCLDTTVSLTAERERASIVQERYAHTRKTLADLQTQLQAITQEMREETCAWGDSQCCAQIRGWANQLAALGKGQQ